jgi:chromosome segregation ATPase
MPEKSQSRPTLPPTLAGGADHDGAIAERSHLAHASEREGSGDAAADRYAAIRSDFERFSAAFNREIAKASAVQAKVEADHAQLGKRFAALSLDHDQAQEALAEARSHAEALQDENSRLRSDNATLATKLEAASSELHAARDKIGYLQSRHEALEADHSKLVLDNDQRELAMIEVRHELTELAQSYEAARTQVEQGRQRESHLEARALQLEAEARDLQSQLDDASRQMAQEREKNGKLIVVLDAAREELESRKRAIAELQSEKESLSAAQSALSIKLDQSRQAVDAKLDALVKTKASLLDTVEKQRKQIEEQVFRNLRLEETNAKLTQELLKANNHPRPATDDASDISVLPRLELRVGEAQRQPTFEAA